MWYVTVGAAGGRWPRALVLEGIEATVFRTLGDRPSLRESQLPPELLRLPEELARVDALLDNPAFFAPFAPHPTTLMKLTTRCGDQAVAGLNEALLAKPAGAKLLRTARAYPRTVPGLAHALGLIATTALHMVSWAA